MISVVLFNRNLPDTTIDTIQRVSVRYFVVQVVLAFRSRNTLSENYRILTVTVDGRGFSTESF